MAEDYAHTPQVILNRVYDETTNSLRTLNGADNPDYVLTSFKPNHLDDYTTTSVTYVGVENKDGTWLITKIDESGNFPVFTYATLNNNPTLTSYSDAWTARVTATYNLFSVAV